MLKNFLDKELSDTSDIKFTYTVRIKNFDVLFSYLDGLKEEDFMFNRRNKEIEIYESKYYIGSIRDQGASYLVPSKVLKVPMLNFHLRRMRV